LVTGGWLSCAVVFALEQRVDARLPVSNGIHCPRAGPECICKPQTEAMFWPQVIRGVGIMFCLLPPTRLASVALDLSRVECQWHVQPHAETLAARLAWR
jgi:DHA2 family multidrug resistance protein